MEKNDFLNDLNIGKMIEEIALQKKIRANKLVPLLGNRYQQNGDKIYDLKDMDAEDVIKISYLLEYNLLEVISDKYLSHIPYTADTKKRKLFTIKMDIQTKSFNCYINGSNCAFPDDVHFGEYLKDWMKNNGRSRFCLAEKLNCPPSLINYYYNQKRLKVKKLIELSIALNHNFIAAVYLSQMRIVPSLDQFNDCLITITDQEVRLTNPNNDAFLWLYKRQDKTE